MKPAPGKRGKESRRVRLEVHRVEVDGDASGRLARGRDFEPGVLSMGPCNGAHVGCPPVRERRSLVEELTSCARPLVCAWVLWCGGDLGCQAGPRRVGSVAFARISSVPAMMARPSGKMVN